MRTASQSQAVYHALADPTRRAILNQLCGGARSVNDIAASFRSKRPTISKHLRVLREARVVREERRGRQRIHQIQPTALREIDIWLEPYRRFWTMNLANFRDHLEGRGKGR